MRNLLILLFVGLGFMLSAQSQLNSLKPSDMVAASKRVNPNVRHLDLFEVKSSFTGPKRNSKQTFETLEVRMGLVDEVIVDRPDMLEIEMPYKDGETVELELVKVDILSDQFLVRTQSGSVLSNDMLNETVFYRGVVKGRDQSIATFSFVDDEVLAMYSAPSLGNVSVERNPDEATLYGIFYEGEGTKLDEFYCDVADVGESYHVKELTTSSVAESASKCTEIYFEVDYDIFKEKGGVAETADYVKSLFNEVATIYANEGVRIKISEIFVWDQPSPYTGNTSLDMLNAFQKTRGTFNGDLAQLLSYKASGGIAVVSGLCHPVSAAKMSFASIESSFSKFPNYSFTVLVVAHELGHLFGSMHTHACVWNGNNTAIDACAGFVEGSCSADAGVPSEGGTIMSYCHLTGVGTNFSLGFGLQPGNLIRSRIESAACLDVCEDTEQDEEEEEANPVDGTCDQNQLDLTLKLDYYPMEVVWRIVDEFDQEWYSGGPYVKDLANQEVNERFCLPTGKYYFIIEDYYGDGLCCNYGEGYYLIKDRAGQLIVSGSQYSNEKITSFLIGEEASDPVQDICIEVNFGEYQIESYGGVQDNGVHQIKHRGKSIKLTNSAWKSIPFDYNLGPNTVLEFEFASTLEGDIHAIGFDKDEIPSGSRSFNIFGRQDWGILDYADYEGNSVWKTYTIPVGTYYTGQVDRLFFICDDDQGDPAGNSYFRNVKVYEGEGCADFAENIAETELYQSLEDYGYEESLMKVAPNPAYNQVTFEFFTVKSGRASLMLYNMNQVPVINKEVSLQKGMNIIELELPSVPQGTYFSEITLDDERWSQKIEIIR